MRKYFIIFVVLLLFLLAFYFNPIGISSGENAKDDLSQRMSLAWAVVLVDFDESGCECIVVGIDEEASPIQKVFARLLAPFWYKGFKVKLETVPSLQLL